MRRSFFTEDINVTTQTTQYRLSSNANLMPTLLQLRRIKYQAHFGGSFWDNNKMFQITRSKEDQCWSKFALKNQRNFCYNNNNNKKNDRRTKTCIFFIGYLLEILLSILGLPIHLLVVDSALSGNLIESKKTQNHVWCWKQAQLSQVSI